MSKEDMQALYAPEHLLDIRLQRLVDLGQLVRVEGRYRLASRSLWSIALLMDWWAKLLGYPSYSAKWGL